MTAAMVGFGFLALVLAVIMLGAGLIARDGENPFDGPWKHP